MSQLAGKPPTNSSPVVSRIASYVFDVRFLGVLGQIAFIIFVILAFQSLARNFASNADKLGESQFICRDGRFSYRCAYDFMDNEAGFDIADPPLDFVNTDSYWYAFYNGFLNTVRVGLMSVVLCTVLGLVMGIARLSSNWLISNIALAYVEIIRNTPLLIQLFLIYFGLLLALPNVEDAIQPFGASVFLSNRGFVMPWPRLTDSAPVFLAFVILAIIQFQVMWMYYGRQEVLTGRSTNRLMRSGLTFLAIVIAGWVFTVNSANNEGLLAAKKSRISQVSDIEKLLVTRAGLNHVSGFATMGEEELAAVTLDVCVLRDVNSEPNFTRHLRALGVPYDMRRVNSPEKGTAAFVDEKCELFIGGRDMLAAEMATLENPSSHRIVPVPERPIVMSVPRLDGFNTYGGLELFPELFALFLGLAIFYGGGLAEVVRAGILSVSKGQTEASRALGLSEGQRLQLIVLPQSLRVIIPPLISTYLSLMKDTSLGLAIGFADMFLVSRTIMNQSGRALQIMAVIMVVYLAISLTFSIILNAYNNSVMIVER
ncbi:MAG: ABC transporter permease subunit [Candidatus Promineifilaceae bacterium]